MADFVNLQVLGVPVLTYGLIGVTTAVLAYATSVGMGDTISKSMESLTEITESPMSALSNMNPLSNAESAAESTTTGEEKSPEPAAPAATDSGLEGLNPFASSEGQGEAKEKPAEEPPKETTGGKKRRKKTPKSKKAKRKNKSKKAKK